MNKFLKTILIIFSLVLLSIFLSVVAIYYFIASNPLDFSSLQQFVLTNQYAQLYLFWVAAALAILWKLGKLILVSTPYSV